MRIYETENSLKFEHEMKGKWIQNFHDFLVSNRLEEFEEKLVSHFLVSFGKLLPLEFSYLDWLTVKLRPIRKQPHFPVAFNSEYIDSEIIMEARSLVSLLQFLKYARSLDFETDSLGDVRYRKVVFQLQDFFKIQNPGSKSMTDYQLKKMKEFFGKIQTGRLQTSFSDGSFQSLAMVPQVKFEKDPKQKCWIGEVWVVEKLFSYQYPFQVPDLFQKQLPKDRFEVQFYFLKVFSSVNLEKEFLIREFLDSYPSTISNQRQTNIKKYFIELVESSMEKGLIENSYKILSEGNYYPKEYPQDRLTPQNISEGFVIYEKLEF